MRNVGKGSALLLVISLLLSCNLLSSPNSPTSEVTPFKEEATKASTPDINPSAPPSNTGTPFIPTSSPVPVATATPASPTSLNLTGPYILFKGSGGIWITNPDGSFPTQLIAYEFQGDLRRAISPAGDRLALVVRSDQGLDLVLVKIPSGERKKVTQLIILTEQDAANATSAKSIASYAIHDFDALAWQPGSGRFLAFTGAMHGPTSDLYLYDTQTEEITQLTDGPSQAIMPNWSPDGKYILHFGVSWVPPFGGAIIGPNRLDGVWAIKVSDQSLVALPKPTAVRPNFVGWLDDAHYITYDSSDECYSQKLRSIDVTGGKAVPIMDYSFYYGIARSPENGAFLFSSKAGCTNSPGDGIFLLLAGQTTPSKLLDRQAYEVDWLPESQVFNAYPEVLFSSDGQMRYEPPVYDKSFHPAISKEGYQAWQVIENQKGRVVVQLSSEGWRTILDGLVDQLIWDPLEGKTLLIVMDDGSLYAAAYPDFIPQLRGNLGKNVDQAIWLR